MSLSDTPEIVMSDEHYKLIRHGLQFELIHLSGSPRILFDVQASPTIESDLRAIAEDAQGDSEKATALFSAMCAYYRPLLTAEVTDAET